ncbi:MULTISPECIES: putative quinol monooxygenase [unclassified Vibrio]|uniref:Antibiotic biosynthesis monooxygenase n=1 Tax=Vibrio sp. HB236076 TaxID=3232307 RepID=A0AB39HIC5_9VIBR|nr:antibiotic biosynthesis monooxygenase [Vibrio sp. HB161653]MDP5252774.1 antibiotic biosynthesis monooxygenase [Vibrio sp. HB161653]
MTKIILKGFILVPCEDLQIVEQELPTHTKLTLEEDGCLAFSVTKNKANPNRFDVYEVFTDRQAFDQHQIRVKHSYWGQVTANVERHYEIFD